MDPLSLLSLAFTLVKEGPAAISFAEQTYTLFTQGTITADQLGAMWSNSVAAVKAAEAKWNSTTAPAA